MAVIMRSAATITGAAFATPGYTSLWWTPGTAGGSTADATDILARFRAIWEGIKSIMDPTVTFDYDPICIAVEATTGVLTGAFAGTDPTSTVGTGTGDALPHQTQALIRYGTSTVVNGRRLRGRLFVPGMLEGNNTASGTPQAGTLSSITTAAATIFTPGATASSAVIWHRPTGGSGGSSALITSASTAPTWSVLRSRRG